MDQAMKAVNRQTWTRTRPVMMCQVMGFFSWLGVALSVAWGLDTGWFLFFFGSNLLFKCLSMSFLWQVEISD